MWYVAILKHPSLILTLWIWHVALVYTLCCPSGGGSDPHPNMDAHMLFYYKLIQRFRVTGLFAGQDTTGYYGTFTDVILAHLQMLYSEWLDQDLFGRIKNKSPPILFSLAS